MYELAEKDYSRAFVLLFIRNHLKGKGELDMGIKNYVRNCTMSEDREGMHQTQWDAIQTIETGRELPLWLVDKIDNFANHYGFEFGEVLGAIASSTILAAKFAKSSTRRSIGERCQVNYLADRGIGVEVMERNGHESLRLLHGNLVRGFVSNDEEYTKSVDFKYGNDLIFAKWTDGYGGGQDNQARDVRHFLKQAAKYVKKHDDDYRFVALLDGNYYDKHKAMFDSYTSDRVIIETSDTYMSVGTDKGV